MTVSDIIGLAASEAFIQHRSGNITDRQMDSLNHIAGHSSRTMKQFYLTHSYKTYVRDGQQIFDSLESLTPADSPFKNPPPLLQWGTKHPQYKVDGQRIEWTDYEAHYVGRFVEQNRERASHVYAKCLKAIRNDPIAVENFHIRHVESSSRLKYGYDKYVKDSLLI
jgi:hypothetical protein